MTNLLINNESLQKFIEKVRLDGERRDFLLSKIPYLTEDERIGLFQILSKIYLLDLEEDEVFARLKKFYESN